MPIKVEKLLSLRAVFIELREQFVFKYDEILEYIVTPKDWLSILLSWKVAIEEAATEIASNYYSSNKYDFLEYKIKSREILNYIQNELIESFPNVYLDTTREYETIFWESISDFIEGHKNIHKDFVVYAMFKPLGEMLLQIKNETFTESLTFLYLEEEHERNRFYDPEFITKYQNIKNSSKKEKWGIYGTEDNGIRKDEVLENHILDQRHNRIKENAKDISKSAQYHSWIKYFENDKLTKQDCEEYALGKNFEGSTMYKNYTLVGRIYKQIALETQKQKEDIQEPKTTRDFIERIIIEAKNDIVKFKAKDFLKMLNSMHFPSTPQDD